MSRRPLSGRHRDVLRDGPGLDQPLHSALLTLCHAWQRSGWSRQEAEAELLHPDHQLGVQLRRRSNWRRQFERAWDKALAVDTKDRFVVLAALNEYRLSADAMPWDWRGGSTDRVTYEALLILCETRGRFSTSASIRDLAVLATLEPRTVAYSLERLAARNLAQRLTIGSGDHASIWKPRSPRGCSDTSHHSPGARPERSHCSPATRNASGKPQVADVPLPRIPLRQILGLDVMAALSSADARVLSLVSARPFESARAVARALGVSPATAQRSLEHLDALALVNRGTWGWTTSANVGAVLQSLSKANFGFKDRLRARLEEERQTYREARSQPRFTSPPRVAVHDGELVVDADTGEIVPEASPRAPAIKPVDVPHVLEGPL